MPLRCSVVLTEPEYVFQRSRRRTYTRSGGHFDDKYRLVNEAFQLKVERMIDVSLFGVSDVDHPADRIADVAPHCS